MTVNLTSPAPAGGILVGLTSSDTNSFPSGALVIPQGASSASTQMTAAVVASTRWVTLTASYGTGSTSTTFNIAPPALYLLTTAISPTGTGTVNPSGGSLGSPLMISATPASGYQFTGFSANGAVYSTNPAYIPMTGPTTVTASFAPVTATPLVLSDGAPQATVLTNNQPTPVVYQLAQGDGSLIKSCTAADPNLTVAIGTVSANSIILNVTASTSATGSTVPMSCHWTTAGGEGGLGLPPARVRRLNVILDPGDPGGDGGGAWSCPSLDQAFRAPNNGQQVTWTYYNASGDAGSIDDSISIQTLTYPSPRATSCAAAFALTYSAVAGAPVGARTLDCQYGNLGYTGWADLAPAVTVYDTTPILTPPASPAYGLVGSTVSVTLNGTRLDGVTAINFRGAGCPGAGCPLAATSITAVSASSLTFDLSIAAGGIPGAYSISVASYGIESNSVAFDVYDATPTITSVYPLTSPTPGVPFTVEIDGSNFGASQGTATVCLVPTGGGPCTQSTNFPTIQIGSWSLNVVFVTLTSLASAPGHYCIQLTSKGGNGSNFLPAPNGGSTATSACAGDFTTSYSISGKITAGGKPLQGVTVTYNSGSSTTDKDGNYRIPVDQGYNVTILPYYSGYTLPFTPGNGTASSCTSNPSPSRPTSCYFSDVQGNQTQDFTTTFTTIFLLHGIGQGSSAMRGLFANLTDSTGVDLSRFVVNAGFDFSECAAAGPNCASTCSISTGGKKLATQYIANAPGDVVLVGYSMGGLIARDVLVNGHRTDYASVLDTHNIRGLVTLGTPHWGYPMMDVDKGRLCPQLETDMAGSWNWLTKEPNPLSPFLSTLNASWSPSSYGGYWLAAAGRFCNFPARINPLNPAYPPYSGCLEPNGVYSNDGVVCADSAQYSSASVGSPTELFDDSNHNYSHTDTLLGFGTALLMGCKTSSTNGRLFDPRPNEDPFQQMVTLINKYGQL